MADPKPVDVPLKEAVSRSRLLDPFGPLPIPNPALKRPKGNNPLEACCRLERKGYVKRHPAADQIQRINQVGVPT